MPAARALAQGFLTAVRMTDLARGSDADGGRRRNGKTYSISELTSEFDVTPRSLRFYESRGLLTPVRAGLSRIYSDQDRARLKLILHGKRLGFTLLEIRMMLQDAEAKNSPEAPFDGSLHLTEAQTIEQLELLRQQQEDIEKAIGELEASLLKSKS